MKRITVLLTALLLALSMVGTAAANNSADRQASDVYEWPAADPPVQVEGADARLVRTDAGVSYNLRTTGLEKGHATSIWWVIFNNPDECVGPCGVPDLFNPAVEASVQSGGGNMVGGSGNSAYADHLRIGETTNPHPFIHEDSEGRDEYAPMDPPIPPPVANHGLLNPRGAEIHLVLRTHGPAIPGMNHVMFNSYEVGCSPATSFGAGEGTNDCADVQFTIFLPPPED